MNIFLLAPILGCVSEIVRGEMSEAVRARENESSPSVSQNVRERKLSKAQTIYVNMSRDQLQTRFIFTWDKFKTHVRSWKHTVRDYSVPSGSRNYLIYWHLFFRNKWVLDPIFLNFFAPRGPRRPFKKYWSVNPMIYIFLNIINFGPIN